MAEKANPKMTGIGPKRDMHVSPWYVVFVLFPDFVVQKLIGSDFPLVNSRQAYRINTYNQFPAKILLPKFHCF